MTSVSDDPPERVRGWLTDLDHFWLPSCHAPVGVGSEGRSSGGAAATGVRGGAQFYLEVVDAGGPATIRDDGAALSFDGVRATVEGIATELAQVWDRVKPSEASVAFGLKVTAKSGKLTGLVVEGGGEATLTVTLTWKQSQTVTPSAPSVPDVPDAAETAPDAGNTD